MGRDHRRKLRWRSIRVPLRVVERAYGRDHHDNAGDDMVNALSRVSEWSNQYRYRFVFDTAHSNPWFHAMVFEVEGVPDTVFTRLLDLLAEHGLVPESD